MSTVGDVLSTVEDVQYRRDIIFCYLSGGYHEYRGVLDTMEVLK